MTWDGWNRMSALGWFSQFSDIFHLPRLPIGIPFATEVYEDAGISNWKQFYNSAKRDSNSHKRFDGS